MVDKMNLNRRQLRLERRDHIKRSKVLNYNVTIVQGASLPLNEFVNLLSIHIHNFRDQGYQLVRYRARLLSLFGYKWFKSLFEKLQAILTIKKKFFEPPGMVIVKIRVHGFRYKILSIIVGFWSYTCNY